MRARMDGISSRVGQFNEHKQNADRNETIVQQKKAALPFLQS
jgi:hypothetical protein